MAAFSLGLSAKIVMRFGIRGAAGGRAAAGRRRACAVRARARSTAASSLDVLPGMLLLGLGAGIAFNPLLLAAMSDVEPQESGLASGIVNTAFMMGGALGLAVLASLAAARTERPARRRRGTAGGADGGYQLAFLVGAVFAATAGGLAAALLAGVRAAARAGDGAGARVVASDTTMPTRERP